MNDIPPDDLPKSRTGRIPQWVQQEAAGRPASPTTWRPPTVPTLDMVSQPRRHARARSGGARRLVPLTLVLLLLAAGTAYLGRGGQFPWNAVSQSEYSSVESLPLPQAPNRSADAPGKLSSVTGGRVINPSEPQTGGHAAFPPPGLEEGAAPLGLPALIENPSTAYAFENVVKGTSEPVSWSPCRPIHLVINSAGAPRGFTRQVLKIAAEVSYLTGLRFINDGTTRERPSMSRDGYLPARYGNRWAPVLVAVILKTRSPRYDNVAGLARNVVGQTSTTGLPHIVSSQVLVMKSAFAQKLPDGTPLFAQVLRHEFGHMASLGHTDALSQIMDAQNVGVPTYQDGDRTGLSRLGAGPCAPDL